MRLTLRDSEVGDIIGIETADGSLVCHLKISEGNFLDLQRGDVFWVDTSKEHAWWTIDVVVRGDEILR